MHTLTNKLNILNGDGAFPSFSQSNLPGEVRIFREMLCEGPAKENFNSEAFWKTRVNFMTSLNDISEEAYFQKTKDELLNGADLEDYEEITLWFEYDLFCQINMVALLAWFYQLKLSNTISLVCIGKVEGYDKMVGLGEVDPKLFKSFYEQRVNLNDNDLLYAQQIWLLYCSPHHSALTTLMVTSSNYQLEFIESALQYHLLRFPSRFNGLNLIEQQMVELVSSKAQTKNGLIRSMLEQDYFYGYGDLQYDFTYRKLAPLFKMEDDLISLSELGHQIIDGSENYSDHRTYSHQYGGAEMNEFYWDSESNLLVPA